VKGDLIVNSASPGGASSDDVLLSYTDIFAIKQLAELDSRWGDIYRRSLLLLEKGEVSRSLPFYKETYDVKKGDFMSQTAYNIVSCLLVMYYKSELGILELPQTAWLQKQCDGKGLYASYTQEGQPVSKIQSTAIYSLVILIAKNTDDKDLSRSARSRLGAFQVKQADSPIYGAFGNANTLETYSFDNLLALLALTPVS
jgi:hypothetical protein